MSNYNTFSSTLIKRTVRCPLGHDKNLTCPSSTVEGRLSKPEGHLSYGQYHVSLCSSIHFLQISENIYIYTHKQEFRCVEWGMMTYVWPKTGCRIGCSHLIFVGMKKEFAESSKMCSSLLFIVPETAPAGLTNIRRKFKVQFMFSKIRLMLCQGREKHDKLKWANEGYFRLTNNKQPFLF